MATSVTVNLKNLEAKLKKMKLANSLQAMRLVGEKALELNETQIAQERDRYGNHFPPYTKRWKEVREKRGLPGDKVDLTITGHMLQNFGVQRVRPNSVTLGFSNPAEAHKALGVYQNENRPIAFVGLTPANKYRLVEWFFKRFVRSR